MPAQLVPFLLFVILLTIIPGPDIALGLRNSLRGGTTAMWWTGLGCCTGLLVHAAASIIGLSALLAASATAYTAVKLGGACYLVWLGVNTLWKSWRDRNQPPAATTPTADRTPHPGLTRLTAFRQGLLSNLLNPKIVLLFLTLLPQFISPGEPRVATSIMLTLTFLAVALVWWRTTSWLVGGMRRMLNRRRVILTLERVTGGVLVAIGVRVAIDGA
ncbi:LysE family translocator [Parasphingorhabdus pacifica]